MALIWASLIIQVPLERHGANAADPFCDFVFRLADSEHFPLRSVGSFFCAFWVLGCLDCGSDCLFCRALQYKQWLWMTSSYSHCHTHTCAHKQRQTDREKPCCLLSYDFVITPCGKDSFKDYIWNKPDSIVRQARSVQEAVGRMSV